MKILFINRMASMVRGGGETFDLEIARHLAVEGCNVTFLSGIPLFSRAITPLRDRQNFTIRTPYFGWFPWDSVKGGWRLRLFDFWCFETAAVRWAWKHRNEFDVIQVCELPTFVTKWKKKKTAIPVVMRLTAPDYHDPAGAIHQASALIASGATLHRVQKDIRPDCINIPNGVDVNLFKPQASSWREKNKIGSSEFIVLFVARFQRVKNHAMLVEAFASFSARISARLVLAGSGPLEQETKSLVKRLGIIDRVLFLGETSFAVLPEIYASADVKVISSDYESFCFAALEAMATELPVITTDTDWVPKLIERDRGGKTVPIGDASAMAEALTWMLQHPDERRAMGLWNRQKVLAHFTWTNSAQKLKMVYQQLLS